MGQSTAVALSESWQGCGVSGTAVAGPVTLVQHSLKGPLATCDQQAPSFEGATATSNPSYATPVKEGAFLISIIKIFHFDHELRLKDLPRYGVT